MITKQQKQMPPPKLMQGLFSLIVAITFIILLSAWGIINYQVEQLVAKRTSEYALSIAQIAANSSAEALLSDDKIQLKMLVENVAKDPYIRSATIFAEDGQTIAQFPKYQTISAEEKAITSKPTDKTAVSSKTDITHHLNAVTKAYIQSQNDIPFIEKITYQNVTAGWFKITLNRQLLESSFRQSLKHAQQIILIISISLFSLLLIISYKFNKRVKQLIQFCHRLIQINAPKLPQNNQQWMESIEALSQTQFQSLNENNLLPTETPLWTTSRRNKNTVFCYCQFSMLEQGDPQTAYSLSLAEQYLKAAVQTHGVQSQGEVLSGCLIPFLDSKDENEALEEALNLVYLIKELFASITVEIRVRAFIGKGSILILENDRAVITGVSLSNRLYAKINNLTSQSSYGDVICLGFEPERLNVFGQFDEKQTTDTKSPSFHLLRSFDESIKQQTVRQINYIITNYCNN